MATGALSRREHDADERRGGDRMATAGLIRRRAAAGIAVALMIAQTIASSFSRLPAPPGAFPGIDKVAHAGAWMLLGGCLGLAFERRRAGRRIALATGLAVLFGVFDELHQAFVPGRSSSGFDLIADFAGAWVGAMIATWYRERRCRSDHFEG